MKSLSQALDDLAERIKALEASATATFEADRAKLEKRRHEIDESLKSDVSEFESSVRDAAAAGRTRWAETKESMRRSVDELRARIDKRESEHEVHRAVRIAENAEEDAAAAIELANYFINVAEYAVIDATLARMSADELTDQATTSSAGATS